MNGEVCCILGVCCPPLSAGQRDAMVKEMMADGVCDDAAEAKRVAGWVLKHFDLAPAGTLAPFKREMAKVIEKHAAAKASKAKKR